ncbi:MAG: helix-turn-helix transcriptional regulator [Oscillibacter sp.]|jgi:transcriptional regulator with XRE-family HTH domain|nr:helix-turn-helix transcriptional regulator [Oscillibacter sp.]
MQILAKRLKELREGRRIYQRELAEILGMSFRGYQNYETGQSEPKLATLVAIADYYQVSIDYLVGRTDAPDFHTSKAED